MIKTIILALILISMILISTGIFYGKEEPITKFPYQVAIHYENVHICGGSIIDDRTVLTAAHCVHGDNYNSFSVRVGHNHKDKGKKFYVINIIEHDQFNRTGQKEFDIAILGLDFPMKFSPRIQPIALQKSDVIVSGRVSVSGWGQTEFGSDPDYLRATYVDVVSNEECQEEIEDIISEDMLCSYSSTADQTMCHGDSGGPVVYNDKLIGIISGVISDYYNETADLCSLPSVHVRVSKVYEWIILNKNKKQQLHCLK